MYLLSIRKKSANNNIKRHLFSLLVKKSVHSLTFGTCWLESAIFLTFDFVSLAFGKTIWYLYSCFMWLCNRFVHSKNVGGIILTTCIASTIQHSTLVGTVIMHGTWDMDYILFLNRDELLIVSKQGLTASSSLVNSGTNDPWLTCNWPLRFMFQVKPFVVKLS